MPLLSIDQSILNALDELRAKPKFLAENFYPGAPNETLRVDAESQLNQLLDRLVSRLPTEPAKETVLSEFRIALSAFKQPDTEERERFCGYLEEIMDITGVESSDGLLNEWLYGFDPLNP